MWHLLCTDWKELQVDQVITLEDSSDCLEDFHQESPLLFPADLPDEDERDWTQRISMPEDSHVQPPRERQSPPPEPQEAGSYLHSWWCNCHT